MRWIIWWTPYRGPRGPVAISVAMRATEIYGARAGRCPSARAWSLPSTRLSERRATLAVGAAGGGRTDVSQEQGSKPADGGWHGWTASAALPAPPASAATT